MLWRLPLYVSSRQTAEFCSSDEKEGDDKVAWVIDDKLTMLVE